MATDLGKVGMVMKGDWSSSATYEVLDAVSYNNGLYIAKQAVPANTAPTNTTYWQVALKTHLQTIGSKSNIAANDTINLSANISSFTKLHIAIGVSGWGTLFIESEISVDLLNNNWKIFKSVDDGVGDSVIVTISKLSETELYLDAFTVAGASWTIPEWDIIVMAS